MSNKNTTQETYLKRTTFKITSKCTLKCKLCLAYIPYYKNPKDLSYENAKKILARFFSLVDKIGTFSITGGEPFINKISKIRKKIRLHYCYFHILPRQF